jgi:hypothetical protein
MIHPLDSSYFTFGTPKSNRETFLKHLLARCIEKSRSWKQLFHVSKTSKGETCLGRNLLKLWDFTWPKWKLTCTNEVPSWQTYYILVSQVSCGIFEESLKCGNVKVLLCQWDYWPLKLGFLNADIFLNFFQLLQLLDGRWRHYGYSFHPYRFTSLRLAYSFKFTNVCTQIIRTLPKFRISGLYTDTHTPVADMHARNE